MILLIQKQINHLHVYNKIHLNIITKKKYTKIIQKTQNYFKKFQKYIEYRNRYKKRQQQ